MSDDGDDIENDDTLSLFQKMSQSSDGLFLFLKISKQNFLIKLYIIK